MCKPVDSQSTVPRPGALAPWELVKNANILKPHRITNCGGGSAICFNKPALQSLRNTGTDNTPFFVISKSRLCCISALVNQDFHRSTSMQNDKSDVSCHLKACFLPSAGLTLYVEYLKNSAQSVLSSRSPLYRYLASAGVKL